MKAFLSVSAIAVACGIVGAATCSSKSTTTVTKTFLPGTSAVNATMGTGVVSVYDGTTSVVTITGAVTNPFAVNPTVITSDVVIYSYVTVPAGTCTQDKFCSWMGHGPVVHTLTSNVTTVGTFTTEVPASVDTNSVITVTGHTTLTVTNTLPSDTAAPSATRTDVSSSVTLTSVQTQFTTLIVTAEPETIVETSTVQITESSTVEDTTAATTVVPPASSSILVTTITVSPVPLSTLPVGPTAQETASVMTSPMPVQSATVTVTITETNAANGTCTVHTVSMQSLTQPRPSTSSSGAPVIPVPSTFTGGAASARLRVPAPLVWLGTLLRMAHGVPRASASAIDLVIINTTTVTATATAINTDPSTTTAAVILVNATTDTLLHDIPTFTPAVNGSMFIVVPAPAPAATTITVFATIYESNHTVTATAGTITYTSIINHTLTSTSTWVSTSTYFIYSTATEQNATTVSSSSGSSSCSGNGFTALVGFELQEAWQRVTAVAGTVLIWLTIFVYLAV